MPFVCAFERGGKSRGDSFKSMKESGRAVKANGVILALHADGRNDRMVCSSIKCQKITKGNSFYYCSLMDEKAPGS